tara:strand:+ start:11175 stop:11309 length:135 start_codon:yes stop_codon:yes gene_type:complete
MGCQRYYQFSPQVYYRNQATPSTIGSLETWNTQGDDEGPTQTTN